MQLRLPRLKPWQWVLVATGALAAAAGLFLILRATGAWEALRNLPVRAWIQQLADLGPFPFLLALAVLPAIGAPVSVFYVIAGAVFERHGGLGMALVGCFVAITINIALTYAMARWMLHPLIERVVRRFGWKVPQVRHEDRWVVTLLLRITPGPPFFMQSYLLALGGVPFSTYMLVSVPVVWVMGAGVIVFGNGLASGSVGKIVVAISVIVAAGIIVRLVRKRVQSRAPAAVADVAGSEVPAVVPEPGGGPAS